MIILHHYRISCKDNIYRVISKEPRICPDCGGPMIVRDSKRRQVIVSNGEIQTYLLRRLKCKKCSHLHLELPDLLVPHKHYSRATIEQALGGSVSLCSAEASTIYRWSKEREKQEE